MKTKKMLAILILVVLFFLLFSVLFVVYNKEKIVNPKKEIATNEIESFLKEINVDEILFKDISCTYDGEYSTLKYTIVNNAEESIVLNEYEVVILDENRNTITRINPIITEEINPGEENTIESVIDVDLTKAYYMEFRLDEKEKENEVEE